MAGDTKNAMAAVLEDMGRAAKERRARRFVTKRPAHKGVDVKMGDVTFDPEMQLDKIKIDIDPDAHDEHGMSSADVDDLSRELDVQR